MFVRLVQPLKALSSIFLTDFPSIFAGIISSPDAFSSHPVIVTAYLAGHLHPLVEEFDYIAGLHQ